MVKIFKDVYMLVFQSDVNTALLAHMRNEYVVANGDIDKKKIRQQAKHRYWQKQSKTFLHAPVSL